MNFSVTALLACLSFYSGLYMIYYFFARQTQPLILILAIVLLILAYWITPYSYERKRKNYDSTMRIGELFWYPLISWWRLFIWPISVLLAWLYP
ncbi:hypothetical protein B9T26_08095 [Acinetobacter sp. ANC 4169]|jgi:hypothetical protein|uniref:hypothetical protein n=1 Tax=Acinetobacter sp. ANC 4169 TaxID=1977879 RepID=UPI000A3305E0|nr:hypothetical protein [Acinetobacter sp. ANC 4169]OTG73708.1 hypothetical protein B9T26_08095 [Acinetobacter sp. ANC 4169]